MASYFSYVRSCVVYYIDGVMNITSVAFLNTTLQITETSMIGTVTDMLPFIYGTMWFDDVHIYNNTSLCSTDIIDMNFLLVRYPFENNTQNDSGIRGSYCNDTLHSVGVGSAAIVSSNSAMGTQRLQCITLEYVLLIQMSNNDKQ